MGIACIYTKHNRIWGQSVLRYSPETCLFLTLLYLQVKLDLSSWTKLDVSHRRSETCLFLVHAEKGWLQPRGKGCCKQQSWIRQLASELARALCILRWEIVCLPYSFSVVWNSKLCDEETRWEEKETLRKAYVSLRYGESLRKREKTNSFPRDWCLGARPRLNGSFYIFQLGKASALFPLSPTLHCDVELKKKVQKMKTACVIAAPNIRRGQLDILCVS